MNHSSRPPSPHGEQSPSPAPLRYYPPERTRGAGGSPLAPETIERNRLVGELAVAVVNASEAGIACGLSLLGNGKLEVWRDTEATFGFRAMIDLRTVGACDLLRSAIVCAVSWPVPEPACIREGAATSQPTLTAHEVHD